MIRLMKVSKASVDMARMLSILGIRAMSKSVKQIND